MAKYVEASRDFAKFYDTQVLPEINSDIAKETARSRLQCRPVRLAAGGLHVTRDKILRVIGRDPTAGEQQAREWIRSQDPDLVGDAITVLDDMGDHEEDLLAAKRELKRERDARKAAREGK